MITAIRKSFHSKSYKIFLWIFILALAGVFSMPQLLREMRQETWIIKVNGEQVPFADFALRVQIQEGRIQMLRQQYGQLADMLLQSLGASADPKVFALESLTKDTLLDQTARSMNVLVSQEYIAKKLASPIFIQQELSDLVPMFLVDPYSGINERALSAYLKRMRMSMSDFESRIDRVLERKLLMDLVNGALYLPEFVLLERYRTEHIAKKYSLLHFNFGDYVTKVKKTPVSTEQVKEFYEQHTKDSKRYWTPEQRAGKIWSFSVDSLGASVDEDAVNSYYNEHKRKDFLETPLQVQARRILLKADKNEDVQRVYDRAQQLREELINDPSLFTKKAQELSQDLETAKQGGLMPFFSRGAHHDSFDNAAFLLKNDGDISEVIVTNDGVELIQRVSRNAAIYKPLKSVYKDIEKILKSTKFKEQFAREVQKVISGELPAEEFIKKASGSPKNSALASLDEASQQSKALFRMKAEKEYGFYSDEQGGALVQLTSLVRPYLPTFEALKTTLEHDYYQEQAKQLLQKELNQAKELAKTVELAKLAKQFNVPLKSSESVKRSDAEKVTQLQKKGFPVDTMLNLVNVGETADATVDLDGYLVRLDKVESLNMDEFAAKRDGISKQLQTEYSRMLTEGFVASLGRNATIIPNNTLMSSEK